MSFSSEYLYVLSIKLFVLLCTDFFLSLGKGEELSCAKELNFRLTQSMKSIKAGDLFHPDPKLGLQIVFFLQIRVCISDIEHLSKVLPTNCTLDMNFLSKKTLWVVYSNFHMGKL